MFKIKSLQKPEWMNEGYIWSNDGKSWTWGIARPKWDGFKWYAIGNSYSMNKPWVLFSFPSWEGAKESLHRIGNPKEVV